MPLLYSKPFDLKVKQHNMGDLWKHMLLENLLPKN